MKSVRIQEIKELTKTIKLLEDRSRARKERFIASQITELVDELHKRKLKGSTK
jgi:hypothetical protein